MKHFFIKFFIAVRHNVTVYLSILPLRSRFHFKSKFHCNNLSSLGLLVFVQQFILLGVRTLFFMEYHYIATSSPFNAFQGSSL